MEVTLGLWRRGNLHMSMLRKLLLWEAAWMRWTLLYMNKSYVVAWIGGLIRGLVTWLGVK